MSLGKMFSFISSLPNNSITAEIVSYRGQLCKGLRIQYNTTYGELHRLSFRTDTLSEELIERFELPQMLNTHNMKISCHEHTLREHVDPAVLLIFSLVGIAEVPFLDGYVLESPPPL
jgi:hypothetical protein